MRKSRGISQVVGSLFMLAVVVPIGGVILSQGLGETNELNQRLITTGPETSNSLREDLVFEHIRFEPKSDTVTISIRNIGTIQTSVDKITVVKMDTQEVVFSQNNLASLMMIKDSGDISFKADLPNAVPEEWQDSYYSNSEYKISIITGRGNFFDTIARPFNT